MSQDKAQFAANGCSIGKGCTKSPHTAGGAALSRNKQSKCVINNFNRLQFCLIRVGALRRRCIGSFGSLPSGATRSDHLLCCVFCKGHAIHCKTRLAANRFSSR